MGAEHFKYHHNLVFLFGLNKSRASRVSTEPGKARKLYGKVIELYRDQQPLSHDLGQLVHDLTKPPERQYLTTGVFLGFKGDEAAVIERLIKRQIPRHQLQLLEPISKPLDEFGTMGGCTP